MSRHLTIYLSDDLVGRLDHHIAESKSTAPKPLTPEERKVVHKIADDKGVAAANAYLQTIRPPQPKMSRTTLVEYFIEIGLEAVELGFKIKE
jgi:hypothetical protein